MMIFCRFTYFDPPATVFFSVFLPPYKGSQLYCKSFSVDRENFPNFPKFSLCSVQFSHSVVSNSLRPHESQHARPPCPSPTPRVHPNSCALSRWCHPAISSSVVAFSSCPQSLPASESFPMSQVFAWGGQSTRASALADFLYLTSYLICKLCNSCCW